MTAKQTTLRIEQGQTWSRGWAFTLDGAPLGSGWQVQAQIRKTVQSATVLHEWTSPDGGASLTAQTVGGVASTVVTVALDPADSRPWNWQVAVFDVEIHHTDGRSLRVAEGPVFVSMEVTR